MIRAALAAVGCLFLPIVAFGLVIAWADYSATDKRTASVFGLAAIVVIVAGLALPWRVNVAVWRRRRPGG
jgi:hypothetical protein